MRTSTRTLLTATALLALAAPLAACGSDDDGAGTPAPAITGGGSTPADSATGDSSPDGAASPTGDASPTGASPEATVAPSGGVDGTVDGALAAIVLAETETGGTAFELDREDDPQGWEVSVAVGGEEIDVDVDLAGTAVLRTDAGDDLDDDDRAALDAATVTLADAIRTALAEVDGRLEDVELDDERDTFVWQVSIGDDTEVYVDVATGDVVTVDRD